MSGEEWRTIPGFEGIYEVSDLGRVRSLDRKVTQGNGKVISARGRELRVSLQRDGRRYVYLSRTGEPKPVKVPVDDLVREAFALKDVATVAEPAGPTIHGEIVRVPFRGDDLLCIESDGKPHIVLKPAIEAIGLDYATQYTKLRGRSWAAVGLCPTTGADGKTYQMVATDVRTFLMLLATVDENRVAESVRPKLIAYQAEVADAIESYFTQGGAINPRATEDQLVSIANVTERRLVMLRSAEGLVDRDWLEAKARHEIARGLGEEPEVDLARRPLTTGEFLEDKGVAGEALRSLSPKFGKRVKALYRDKFGTDPAMTERFVGGRLTKVAGYTEQHRDLFEAVWTEGMA